MDPAPFDMMHKIPNDLPVMLDSEALVSGYGATSNVPDVSGRDSISLRAIVHDSLSSMSDWSSVFNAETFITLKDYVSRGERKFKLIGMVASALLVLRGLLGFVNNILTFRLFGAIIDLIFFSVGFLCIAYEYDDRKLPIVISTYVHSEFHIFTSPFGRSILLTGSGLLMLQQPWGLDTILGIFIFSGGVYIFYHMRNAEIALAALKTRVADEAELRALFDRCDADKNGKTSE